MEYKNLVVTTHAAERMKQRSIGVDAVAAAISAPDKKYPGKQAGTTKFIKSVGKRRLHVIAQYITEEHRWLVISVWVRGEDDQAPLSWQLLSLPFKVAFWLGRAVLNGLLTLLGRKKLGKKRGL